MDTEKARLIAEAAQDAADALACALNLSGAAILGGEAFMPGLDVARHLNIIREAAVKLANVGFEPR